jgi:hypothetical protein
MVGGVIATGAIEGAAAVAAGGASTAGGATAAGCEAWREPPHAAMSALAQRSAMKLAVGASERLVARVCAKPDLLWCRRNIPANFVGVSNCCDRIGRGITTSLA